VARDATPLLEGLTVPARLWVVSAAMILVIILGYVALTRLSSPSTDAVAVEAAAADPPEAPTRSAAAAGGAGAGAPTAAVAAMDQPVPFPNIVVAEAIVGPDGVARIETPYVVPPGLEPDPAFQAEIDAWAASIRATLPAIDDLTTLDRVDVEGRLVLFDYRIAINLRDYTLPQDKPEPLIPGLDGWLCDGNTCFDVKAEFLQIQCRSAIRPLLDRGAVGVYKYRDTNGLPIATAVVTGADCAV
jgi:hypothetical protein